MTEKKRPGKQRSPIPQSMVEDICADTYRRLLGAYDTKSMLENDEKNFPGCGDRLLRKRALGYQRTVRFVLEVLHERGALIVAGQPGDIPDLPGDDPVDSDDIPDLEEDEE